MQKERRVAVTASGHELGLRGARLCSMLKDKSWRRLWEEYHSTGNVGAGAR